MPDITEQLRAWAQSLADSTPSAGVETIASDATSFTTNQTSEGGARRRLIAVAASIALLSGVVVAAVSLGGRGDQRVVPAVLPPSSDRPAPPGTPASSGVTSANDATGSVTLDHVVIVDGEPLGDTWVTGLARDDVELGELWTRIGLAEPPPTVDFARDVVVYFGPAESSSCQFQPLVGVSYDPTSRRVFPMLELSAGGTLACTDDANPHAIVVSIARADLPAGDFQFWVDDQDPPACCGANVTRANGDELRASLPSTTAPVEAPPTTVAVGVACRGDLDATAAFASFVSDMVKARTTGEFSIVADCLSGVPAVFDGQPPGCWTPCDGATVSFADNRDQFFAGGDANGAAWFHSLPVSHHVDGNFVDVLESWTMRSSAAGWVFTDPTIEPSIIEREASLEVIDRYRRSIEQGDWETAASMLDDGAINPEERLDLQELAPATYGRQDVAEALAIWCAAGCDTTRPSAADLSFDGSFVLQRGDRTISAVWYEGTYSISGLPFQRNP